MSKVGTALTRLQDLTRLGIAGKEAKHAPTSEQELNRIITALQSKKRAWANMAPADKATLFRECIDTMLEVDSTSCPSKCCPAKTATTTKSGAPRLHWTSETVLEFALKFHSGCTSVPAQHCKDTYQFPSATHILLIGWCSATSHSICPDAENVTSTLEDSWWGGRNNLVS